MRILGLNAFGQNPSACLLIDGLLVGFSHEERFNRLKCSHGLFPSQTIKWLLSNNNLTISDIDVIAFNWDCNKYPWKRLFGLVQTGIFNSKSRDNHKEKSLFPNTLKVIEYLIKYSPGSILNKIRDELRINGHKGQIPKIEFVDHHLCHAYQAYFHSPFQDSLVLVVDGHGEENCVSGYTAINGSFKKILNYKVPFSLGWYYGGMTAYLGFSANSDEGKMMGLAAYGEERKHENIWIDRLDELIKIQGEELIINPIFFKSGSNSYHPSYTNSLVNYITSLDSTLLPIGLGENCQNHGNNISKYLLPSYIDLAYAVQVKLEDALSFIVGKMIKETGIKNLCYSGGVAMNCKANRSLFDRCLLENIFIHPASSDDGSAIGAAFYIAKGINNLKKQTLTHTQYGVSFSDDEIQNILTNCKIGYSKPNDISSIAAKLLSETKIIGWFDGPAEMGARALGARSIIANPFNETVKKRINENVKYRENWRPYCPSILDEYKNTYIMNAIESPFMTIAATATEVLKKSSPAVVHIDDSVRPQTVVSSVLPKWAHLLDESKGYTGHPVVLNTSFNVRGEPIVNSPYDAIRTFYSTGLDALVLGNFLILK